MFVTIWLVGERLWGSASSLSAESTRSEPGSGQLPLHAGSDTPAAPPPDTVREEQSGEDEEWHEPLEPEDGH